jgi:parallel beta-helix repeat protein
MGTGTGTETVQFGVGDLLAWGLVLTTNDSPASVTIDGGGYKVDLTGTTGGHLITVGSGVKLTLKNITFKGLSTSDSDNDNDTYNNTHALIRVDTGGELVLEAGAVISHNNNATADNDINKWGGGVRVEGGTLTMKGGTISNNTVVRDGAGVYVFCGTLTMDGGTISGNITEATNSEGGGVYIRGTDTKEAVFTMSNGTIANNKAVDGGGGVNVNSYTVFTMSGGTIKNNTSTKAGGGVYLNSNSTFTMNNGTISGNTANEDTGGGVHSKNSSAFTMKGGTISGNKATKGGGVAVSNSGTFTKESSNGGTIYGATGNADANTATGNDPKGHAVYVSDAKYRDNTAGPEVGLDSNNW